MEESQFRQLLDKYAEGKCTPEEVRLLHLFYDSYQEETLSDELDAFDRWMTEEEIHRNIKHILSHNEREEYSAYKQRTSNKYARLKVVATFILLFSLGIGGYFAYQDMPVPEVAWIEKSTQKGQKASITLTDGTKVYLNVDSKLSFPEYFEAQQREVILEGEAFFEVSRNPKRPFVIKSGNLTTTVLGTSFNIKAVQGEVNHVTVLSGKVKVNANDDDGTIHEVYLDPEQQAYFDGQLTKKTVYSEQYVAWRERVIRFDELTLEEATAQLERWFNVTIDIEGEAIKKCRISGQYIDESLINVMKSFEHILGIEYQIEGERKLRIIGKKGCKTQI